MQKRRWINRYQPQTLMTGTMLLYIEGVFNMVRGNQLLLVMGILMFPAAYLIANEKKIGWILGVFSSLAAIAIRIMFIELGLNLLFTLIFPIVLATLLLHPTSREYQKIWFK
ncbi:MAG TPA: hypothetical protein QF762_08210 [Acidimicrobiales bacterium]|mgnify:CR=1 FL=1|nr:hypothetical protein [Acidimicrobiales bacterium]